VPVAREEGLAFLAALEDVRRDRFFGGNDLAAQRGFFSSRMSATGCGPPMAPADLPLLTVLTGIGFDPCQRTEVPLIAGKALQIRFDYGNLSAKKLRLRDIGIRKVLFRTGKERTGGVISEIHAFLPLRRLFLSAAGQQTHPRLPSWRDPCSNDDNSLHG
jgi:hypothetical protein